MSRKYWCLKRGSRFCLQNFVGERWMSCETRSRWRDQSKWEFCVIRTNDLIAWRMRIDYESRPFNQQYRQMKRHNRINIDISSERRVLPAMQYVSISIPNSNNTISIYESGEGWCDTRVTSEARGAANKRENKTARSLLCKRLKFCSDFIRREI